MGYMTRVSTGAMSPSSRFAFSNVSGTPRVVFDERGQTRDLDRPFHGPMA